MRQAGEAGGEMEAGEEFLPPLLIRAVLGWEDIQEYGINKQEWLETFLELPFGIPSSDTFRRVFEKINPKEFEQCFRSWVQSLVEKSDFSR